MTVSASYLTLPDPVAMTESLTAQLPGFGDVDWVPQTGSTNADLLARARQATVGAPSRPWLLGTHLQVAGRGRAGRPWRNDAGACLMMSCAFDLDMSGQHLPSLSPLAGLAACEALRACAGEAGDDIRVKWPNDVQWHARKLGGILVESLRRPDRAGYVVVIGMGLNLSNAEALSRDLGREVADWQMIDPGASAPALAAALARAWHRTVGEFQQTRQFSAFAQRFADVDVLAGQPVNVIDNGTVQYTGIAAGCDDAGRLLVDVDGRQRPVSVGDVSIRLAS